jgi:diadenosine tetraphosphate (Ap4A) HIT family hydrolase
MTTAIHRRVAALQNGLDPTVIARLSSGWLVMGDPQVLPGYCLLLPDPVVADLNSMGAQHQQQFLQDMAASGEVIRDETGAVRINYAMFGNVEPALHAHLFPRRLDEQDGQVVLQPWALNWVDAPKFEACPPAELQMRLRRAVIGRVPGAHESSAQFDPVPKHPD